MLPPGTKHSIRSIIRFMNQKLKPFLLDLTIALLVCFPMLRNPTRWLLGSPDVDVWNHVWGPWWWSHSFRNGQLPWSTDLLQAPDGGTLWFIDPILAGLGWPIALLSPVLAYNFMMLFYVAFASWAVRFFARSIGADHTYQWLASAVFATSGWMISELHNGITEAANIGVVALALGCTELACRDQTRPYRSWLIAGAAIGLAMLASPYLATSFHPIASNTALLTTLSLCSLVVLVWKSWLFCWESSAGCSVLGWMTLVQNWL